MRKLQAKFNLTVNTHVVRQIQLHDKMSSASAFTCTEFPADTSELIPKLSVIRGTFLFGSYVNPSNERVDRQQNMSFSIEPGYNLLYS